jgi:nucleotide-binding universal stress UspA family protein
LELDTTKTILLPICGKEVDESAFLVAAWLAKTSKSLVRALHVIEVSRDMPLDADLSEEAALGERILGKIEDRAKAEKCPMQAEIIQARSAGHAIVQEAQIRNAQTIVLGTSRIREITGEYFGRTISYILKNTDCEVIIWRGRTYGQGLTERVY